MLVKLNIALVIQLLAKHDKVTKKRKPCQCSQ